jgi:hypothetical protein
VDFLLADAWFGTKAMLRSTEELSLTAIVRMKKSKLKYRLTTWYLAFQLQYSPVQTATEHFATVLAPYPN